MRSTTLKRLPQEILLMVCLYLPILDLVSLSQVRYLSYPQCVTERMAGIQVLLHAYAR